MDDAPAWTRAEKAGAALLFLLALGLGFIAADILTGSRFFKRGCCDDEEPEVAPGA